MKETWIIPINLKYFDLYGHLQQSNIIAIKKLRNTKDDDTVYLYIASPESEIRFRGIVVKERCTAEDLQKHIYVQKMNSFNEYNYFLIRVEKEFPKGTFPYSALKTNDIGQVQTLARASKKLKNYLLAKEEEL